MQCIPATSSRACPASHASLPRVHNVGPDSAAVARYPMPYGGELPKDTRTHAPPRLARRIGLRSLGLCLGHHWLRQVLRLCLLTAWPSWRAVSASTVSGNRVNTAGVALHQRDGGVGAPLASGRGPAGVLTPKWSASCDPVKPAVLLCGSSGSMVAFQAFQAATSRS